MRDNWWKCVLTLAIPPQDILNNIKTKEEEIKRKEQEINRRKNLAAADPIVANFAGRSGSPPKDVDLRVLLNQPKDTDLRQMGPQVAKEDAKAEEQKEDSDLRMRDPRRRAAPPAKGEFCDWE